MAKELHTYLNPIIKIAEKNKSRTIEDTNTECGGKLNGKYLGTIGDAGTYSFDLQGNNYWRRWYDCFKSVIFR